jgi:hypothetical protein
VPFFDIQRVSGSNATSATSFIPLFETGSTA